MNCKKDIKNLSIEFDKKKNSFVIYSKEFLPLTFLINIFENFKINILSNEYFECSRYKIYILSTDLPKNKIDLLENIIPILKQAISRESYTLCKLYELSWLGITLREIEFIRAITKYQAQLLYELNEKDIISTLIKKPSLTKKIIYHIIHNEIDNSIQEEINSIKDSSQNKIFTLFYTIIKNIEKTNFHLNKEAISFKIITQNFKHMLFGIQPNIEMFVYHKNFNGIHLRMNKIARGGIRYSNRKDFREEIKDLVITQEAKNSLIVPEGAKGGFYIYFSPTKEEFKEIYSIFIDALLDLIDFEPQKDKDFYFVVAADRGTANMSDVANDIAIKKGYFLKDAFASGGSNGYSHKRLGITAKGAIHSTNRFFIEIGKSLYTDEISVVGVGSMRGDVFGNGMLINPKFKLIGAISHKEIFIDPNPDLDKAYKERKRLFNESLSWSSYNRAVLSKGGMIINREEKNVKLTPEVQKLLKTTKTTLDANEIAKKLLTLKVDLLYFGGIGTYVKSSEEFNIHISDKQNESIRVDAKDIKAFAICEGANLALTMPARIEYALKGGKINLDSIDNSAGVTTSDYEVNIKIFLNDLVNKEIITENMKLQRLKDAESEVVKKVLHNNYSQSFILSIDSLQIDEEKFIKIIEYLENNTDYFKRQYFHIPKNEEIKYLYYNNTLIRPPLAIVMQYTKIFIKKYILKHEIIDNIYFDKFIKNYFPEIIYKDFEELITKHPLYKEIIATTITNKIIHSLGIGFLYDFNEELFKHKIVSFLILEELIQFEKINKEIADKNIKQQYSILIEISQMFEFALKWMVKEIKDNNLNPLIFLSYKNELDSIFKEKDYYSKYKKWREFYNFLPAILTIQHEYKIELKKLFEIFKEVFKTFKIDKLLNELVNTNIKNRLEKNLRNEIEILLQYFVVNFVKELLDNKEIDDFKKYIKNISNRYIDIINEIEQIKKYEDNKLSFILHIINSFLMEILK